MPVTALLLATVGPGRTGTMHCRRRVLAETHPTRVLEVVDLEPVASTVKRGHRPIAAAKCTVLRARVQISATADDCTAPTAACGCGKGYPPCSTDGKIVYHYASYTPWSVLPGLFNQVAGDWGADAGAIFKLLEKGLIIAAVVAGIVLLIWVGIKVYHMFRGEHEGEEGGKTVHIEVDKGTNH